uniref:T-cell differentiation antigen CD6 n=1 Tax=Xenopus tropicalis TaxID=8364 RepID=A0A1B8XW57_XENTR
MPLIPSGAPDALCLVPPDALCLVPPDALCLMLPDALCLVPPDSLCLVPPDDLCLVLPDALCLVPPDALCLVPSDALCLVPPDALPLVPPDALCLICQQPQTEGHQTVNRPCEGAVEIKTQSEWLPLCKDSLDVALSVPICNALHCGKPKDPNPSYTEAFTNSSAHVAIHCSAANESLSQCALSYLPPGNCSGPAMISCQGNSSSSEQSLSSCALKYLCGPELSVKLVGGGSPCAGRVELLLDEVWGSICDDGWDALDAQVTCRQLGCGLPLKALGGSHFGSGPLKIHREEVNCSGAERYLWECPAKANHDCSAREHAGVICSGHRAVRLNGGSDGCSGRLEVYLHGVWGTVCNSHWDEEDSEMLCRYLECGSFLKKSISNHSLSTYMAFICPPRVSSTWDCRIHVKNRNICGDEGALGLLCNGK